MSAHTRRGLGRMLPQPGPIHSTVRLVLAGVAGGLLVDAATATNEGLAMALRAVAGFAIFWVAIGAAVDHLAWASDRRRAARWEQTASELDSANSALVTGVRAWRARAINWQAEAERSEAEARIAMLHTPLGQTLSEVHDLPDTRDRQR